MVRLTMLPPLKRCAGAVLMPGGFDTARRSADSATTSRAASVSAGRGTAFMAARSRLLALHVCSNNVQGSFTKHMLSGRLVCTCVLGTHGQLHIEAFDAVHKLLWWQS